MTEADGSPPIAAPGTSAQSPATNPTGSGSTSSAGSASASASGPAPGTGSASAPGSPSTPQRETVIDAVADLLQMIVNWMRQEAAGVMRDKVVLPLQQVGLTVASAMAAATLFVVGMLFLFVALLLVLAGWLGWPGALTLVGVVILIGAGVFTYLKMRSLQS